MRRELSYQCSHWLLRHELCDEGHHLVDVEGFGEVGVDAEGEQLATLRRVCVGAQDHNRDRLGGLVCPQRLSPNPPIGGGRWRNRAVVSLMAVRWVGLSA